MLIALDFDGTITKNPEFWLSFAMSVIHDWQEQLVIVTYRDDRYDRCELLDEFAESIPVYYTRGVAKKWWMAQFAPVEHSRPDVWIDDRPEAILYNSGLNREELSEWRKAQAQL